jgi:transposase
MDAHVSYPLVVLPPEPGTLVPVAADVMIDVETHRAAAEPDPRAVLGFLWRRFCKLAVLFFIALALLRRLRLEVTQLRQQANYWKAQHQRAVQREAELKDRVHLLEGEIRELKRRLFGRKSETAHSTQPNTKPTPPNPDPNAKPRKRGQQPDSDGHGRRNHEHLIVIDESCILLADQQCCSCCGQPFEEIPGTTDGDILEIEVKAHRRRYHRQRYRRTCTCPKQPAVVTAPPPDKLIPKSNLGISIWAMILQHKFEFYQPLHRVLAELRSQDLDLAAGTITGGLKKIKPLFEPLYQGLVDRNREAEHWHGDETRWHVFVKQVGKANFIWYLWVFAAADSIVFTLNPTRAHDVPETHLGDDAEGILNVDRYSAYKAIAQVKAGKIILAFCWAHVRRDSLAVLTGWPELTEWAWSWLEDIGTLYHLNDQRLELEAGTLKHANADLMLRDHVEQMRERCETELADPKLRLPQRKVLTSLQDHWSGLTVFVEHPEVPLDNNKAERCQRGPVVARKNFYGSGSLWSGQLAAMLFSLFQTLQVWGMDPGRWLTAYLTACAKAGGKPPPEPQQYLPWNMTAEERKRLSATKAKPSAPASNAASPPNA